MHREFFNLTWKTPDLIDWQKERWQVLRYRGYSYNNLSLDYDYGTHARPRILYLKCYFSLGEINNGKQRAAPKAQKCNPMAVPSL
jgi:hypothetical protein